MQTNTYDQERSCSRVRKPRSSAKSDRISHPSPLGTRCSSRPACILHITSSCARYMMFVHMHRNEMLFQTCMYFTYNTYYVFVCQVHDVCTYVYTYMYTCIYIYVNVCMYVCVCACVCFTYYVFVCQVHDVCTYVYTYM